MFIICNLAWRQREVPDEWKKAIIVSLHKGKGSNDEHDNYTGISLLSVPKKKCNGETDESNSRKG